MQGRARGPGHVTVGLGWDDLPAVTDDSIDSWFDMTALLAAGSMPITLKPVKNGTGTFERSRRERFRCTGLHLQVVACGSMNLNCIQTYNYNLGCFQHIN